MAYFKALLRLSSEGTDASHSPYSNLLSDRRPSETEAGLLTDITQRFTA